MTCQHLTVEEIISQAVPKRLVKSSVQKLHLSAVLCAGSSLLHTSLFAPFKDSKYFLLFKFHFFLVEIAAKIITKK